MIVVKVFIGFDNDDVGFARQLNNMFKKHGIDGYIFDENLQFNQQTSDKIKKQINNSVAFVAIITKNTNSPSLHQEIGYAIAKNILVITMLEDNSDADEGVLQHGIDKVNFDKETFEEQCKIVVEQTQTNKSKTQISTESMKFLEDRKLTDTKSDDFGTGGNATRLENSTVLFSALPMKLLKDIPITNKEYTKWLETFETIDVQSHSIRFLSGFEKIELGSITYSHEYRNSPSKYLEIRNNRFIEQGWKEPLINEASFGKDTPGFDIGDKIVLRFGQMMGGFNAFIQFCKHHYNFNNYNDDVLFKLSIRNADKLMLFCFGGKISNNRLWAEPYEFWWDGALPHTNEHNISIDEQITISNLSKKNIEDMVKKFAVKIANAYGLKEARCYNQDGTLNDKLLEYLAGHKYYS